MKLCWHSASQKFQVFLGFALGLTAICSSCRAFKAFHRECVYLYFYAYWLHIVDSLHILLSHCKFHFYWKTCILASFFWDFSWVEFQAHSTVLAMEKHCILREKRGRSREQYETYNCFKDEHLCWKSGLKFILNFFPVLNSKQHSTFFYVSVDYNFHQYWTDHKVKMIKGQQL